MLPSFGTMNSMMPKNAMTVTLKMTIGYIMALLIFLRMLASCSTWVARRFRISSKIPPSSPARTMLT